MAASAEAHKRRLAFDMLSIPMHARDVSDPEDAKIMKKLVRGMRTRVHPDKFPPGKFSDEESELATRSFQALGQIKDMLGIK